MPAGKRGQPVHMSLAKQLGVSIVTGPNGPGTNLPGEIELAEQHGVSRGVIRESLRMLSAKGLVESKPKVGRKCANGRTETCSIPNCWAGCSKGHPRSASSTASSSCG